MTPTWLFLHRARLWCLTFFDFMQFLRPCADNRIACVSCFRVPLLFCFVSCVIIFSFVVCCSVFAPQWLKVKNNCRICVSKCCRFCICCCRVWVVDIYRLISILLRAGPERMAQQPPPPYLVDHKRGEVNELKALLRNQRVERDPNKKREVIKKVNFFIFRLFCLLSPCLCC